MQPLPPRPTRHPSANAQLPSPDHRHRAMTRSRIACVLGWRNVSDGSPGLAGTVAVEVTASADTGSATVRRSKARTGPGTEPIPCTNTLGSGMHHELQTLADPGAVARARAAFVAERARAAGAASGHLP